MIAVARKSFGDTRAGGGGVLAVEMDEGDLEVDLACGMWPRSASAAAVKDTATR
jgi:hypothetical protein